MEDSDTNLTHKESIKKIVVKENIRIPVVKNDAEEEEEERQKRNVYSLQRIHATTNFVNDYLTLYKDVDKSDYVDDLMETVHKKYDVGTNVDRSDQSTQTDLKLCKIDYDNINDVIKMICYDDSADNEFKDIYSSDDEFFSVSSENVKEGLDLDEAKNMMCPTKFGIRTDQVTGEVLLIFYDEKCESETISLGKGLVDDVTISVNPKWGKKAEVVVKDEFDKVVYPLPVVYRSKEPVDYSKVKGYVQAYSFYFNDYDDDDSDPFNLGIATHGGQDSPDSSASFISLDSDEAIGETDGDKDKTQKSFLSKDKTTSASSVNKKPVNDEVSTSQEILDKLKDTNGSTASEVQSERQLTGPESVDATTQSEAPVDNKRQKKSRHKIKPIKSQSGRFYRGLFNKPNKPKEQEESSTQTEKLPESDKESVSKKETNQPDQVLAEAQQANKKSSVLDTLQHVEEEMKPLKNKLAEIQRQMWEIDSSYSTGSTPTTSQQQEPATIPPSMYPTTVPARKLTVPGVRQSDEYSQPSQLRRNVAMERHHVRAEIPISKIKEMSVAEMMEKLIPKKNLSKTVLESRSIWTEPEDDDEDHTDKDKKSKKDPKMK